MLVELYKKVGIKVSRLGYYTIPIERSKIEFEKIRSSFVYSIVLIIYINFK